MNKKTAVKVTSGAMITMLTIGTFGMPAPVNAAASQTTVGNYRNVELTDMEMAEAIAAKLPIPKGTRDDITLPTSLDGAKITYSSSNSWVLSSKGVVHSKTSNTDVTLTATIQYGKETLKKEYVVTVFQIPSYAYGYDFTDVESTFAYPFGSLKIFGGAYDAKAYFRGTTCVVDDAKRNKVVQITNEPGAKGVNYLEYSNVLCLSRYEGFTVNMWVNPSAPLSEHNVLLEASKDGASRFRIDGMLNCHINANGITCDITPNVTLKQDEWQLVTFAMDATSAKIYVNGKLVEEQKKDFTTCLDYNSDGSIQKAWDICTGYGVLADDEDIQNAKFSNIFFHKGKMNNTEVMARYMLERR